MLIFYLLQLFVVHLYIQVYRPQRTSATNMASIPLLQCFSLQKDEIFMELLGSFSHESLHKENETTVAIK